MSGFAIDVLPEWLDYNGHVTDSAYATIAATANEELLAGLDLSAPYRARTGRALYTAQLMIRYRAEIPGDAVVNVERTVAKVGSASLTVASRISADAGRTAAECEHVYVHVDTEAKGALPFSADQLAVLRPLVGRAC